MHKESKKQLLVIEPKNEIAFRGPYDHVVTEYFTLQNPTEFLIAFKVKTTAPKRYCVRPNNGQISPHETVQVAVMLQPGDLTQEKNKHKFMIQSVIVPKNISNINLDELFKSTSPENLMDSKFKCIFIDEPSTASQKGSSQSSTYASIPEHPGVNSEFQGEESVSTNVLALPIASNKADTQNQQIHDESGRKVLNDDCEIKAEDYFSSVAAKTETTVKNRKMPSKNTDNLISSNATQENEDIPQALQDDYDVELKLKLANEEIKKLKDKLQQVQRYASKLASSPIESSIENNERIRSGLMSNKQQLSQFTALIVFISFIVGIFLGKILF
ncbi:helix-loop-helix protein 1-like [Sarcoptes scabiei]|nr:helix-loop-helix protein 1-like [Sarcoptes scabiei]